MTTDGKSPGQDFIDIISKAKGDHLRMIVAGGAIAALIDKLVRLETKVAMLEGRPRHD